MLHGSSHGTTTMGSQHGIHAGRYQRQHGGAPARRTSRRAVSLAAGAIAAGALALGIYGLSQMLTTMRPANSETQKLAEAAQQRAQYQDGKRLLDRIGGDKSATATVVSPAAKMPTAAASDLRPVVVQAITVPPAAVAAKSAQPSVVALATAAPPVIAASGPPPALPPPAPAASPSAKPGLFEELWSVLSLKASATPSKGASQQVAIPPQVPSSLPAIAAEPTVLKPAQPQIAAFPAPTAKRPPEPAVVSPKVASNAGPSTTAPALLPALPPALPAVRSTEPAFPLQPFDIIALARFRATERDRSLAALPIAPTAALPQPAPNPLAPGLPPVAATVPAPPSFGSVDPVPMAAEAAHKSGRQGSIACATIIEQAQIGELSAEDRLILQQRRCR